LVIWGVDGSALVEIIPPNLRVNAKYFCEFAISDMEANVKTDPRKQGLKYITFHWDNAPIHTTRMTVAKIRELGMSQVHDPSYSPDIAPSDYFLFAYLKQRLQGSSYDSSDELFSAITNLMENLEKLLLRRVVDEWISRFHLVVQSGGEYIQI
jgi:transposase